MKEKTILTVSNVIAMILELIAARIMSPYIGSSNTVWTIVIGLMLLGNALGNYYGGKLADKYDTSKLNSVILSISALATWVIYIVHNAILTVTGFSYGIPVLLLLITIPCIGIGMISPVVSKRLMQKDNNGKTAGLIFTLITVGSLIGTFLGGFVIIPKLGSNNIICYMAVILAVLSIVEILPRLMYKRSTLHFVLNTGLIICIIFSRFMIGSHQDNFLIFDTRDNYIRIYDDVLPETNEKIKVFQMSGGFSSAIYTDKNKQNELVFPYLRAYDDILISNGISDKTAYLMIGGAGYTFPRYLLSHYDDKTIDVIELDEDVEKIAREYYGFEEYITKYSDRLGLYTDDGRMFVSETDNKYDVVLNDAFSGDVPARTLATKEAVHEIHGVLNEKGIYMSNVIGSPDDDFIKNEFKTIASEFEYVWLVHAGEMNTEYTNYIIVASDYDYKIKGVSCNINDAELYTDDYSPVDYLDY